MWVRAGLLKLEGRVSGKEDPPLPFLRELACIEMCRFGCEAWSRHRHFTAGHPAPRKAEPGNRNSHRKRDSLTSWSSRCELHHSPQALYSLVITFLSGNNFTSRKVARKVKRTPICHLCRFTDCGFFPHLLNLSLTQLRAGCRHQAPLLLPYAILRNRMLPWPVRFSS